MSSHLDFDDDEDDQIKEMPNNDEMEIEEMFQSIIEVNKVQK